MPIPTRSRIGRNRPAWRIACGLVVALGVMPLTVHAGFEKHLTLDARALELVDLIGEVYLESTSGTAYEIIVRVDGRDASEDRVTLEQKPGDPARVLVRFPVDKERNYVYPRLEGSSGSNFSLSGLLGGNQSWLDWLVHGGDPQIKVRGHGSGLELWADVTIRVPAGRKTTVRLGFGQIRAEGITGDVTLDTQCGPVSAAQITGVFVADTGSGDVQASGIQGRLIADTGSGNVQLGDCSGPEILADTGSGNVKVDRTKCQSLNIDTGSGNVGLAGVDVQDLAVDTGSGAVTAEGLGADALNVDTGSGAVELVLVRMGPGVFVIDTGSGAIELTLPAEAEAQVHAETGSGPITYDSADERFRADDEIEFRIGDRGSARIDLDTGSGAIRIRQ